MVSPLLILLAALLAAAAVAVAARFARWTGTPTVLAAAGTFVAVLGWRLLANLLSLNEDFMPAVSVADTVCLIAAGALVAFLANVVVL